MRPAITPENSVLRKLLDQWSETAPERPFVCFGDGETLSYAEFRLQVRCSARALQDLGVRQGDAVLLWLPNGIEALRYWFAINYIGAIYVPINVAYKGNLLEHVIRNSGARLGIVHGKLVERLRTVDLGRLETLVAIGSPADGGLDGVTVLDAAALDADAELLPLERPIQPWDTQSIIYTSGTTGPSKGVLSSYAHLCFMGLGVVSDRLNQPFVTVDDRYLITSPLFHVGGTSCVYGTLLVGGAVVLIESFDTATFWTKINEMRTTCVVLLGAMASFLVNQPPTDGERASTLKHATIVPMTGDGVAFGRRFGVTTHTLFSMSEIAVPLISDPNPTVVGSCGRARDGVEIKIVDAFDNEVATGETGELVLRPSLPWTITHGYNADAEATAAAWRNGWFHTGDAFRCDDDGCYFFVDRFKDSIRRRGENISSFEVEMEICGHPDIREAAAIAVPSRHGEDEILVAISCVDERTIDLEHLVEYLRPRLAHFMLPRYFRVLDDLPKTPTRKVEKYRLRQEGITPDTWDREAAGIFARRDKLA